MAEKSPANDDTIPTQPNRTSSEPIGHIPKKDVKQQHEDDNVRQQSGVAQAEAITSIWTTKALWLTFILLYIVQFIDSFTSSTQNTFTPYVTSAFQEHALLSTTSVLSTIVGGVAAFPIAKIINVWGRTPGYAIMAVLLLLGLVLKAACRNVETYAAAQTLYWLGHIGLGYIISVYIADMTSLRRRMVMFGLFTTPLIATTFAGPAMAQEFLDHSTFRWGFGVCTILMGVFVGLPLVSFVVHARRWLSTTPAKTPRGAIPEMPQTGQNLHFLSRFVFVVFGVFVLTFGRAKRQGLIEEKASGRSLWQSMWYYGVEFDVVAIILVIAGTALILLPLTLASSSAGAWRSGHIIAMLVVGVVCMIAFVIWERFFAPVPFLPWKYLKNRTILGACIAYFTLFLSIYCWDIYFSSYLQVVNRTTARDANYILNSYSLTSAVLSPLVGLLIDRIGRFKWIGLSGLPFATLGTALLVYFRQPGSDPGYLIMCQIFNGVAGAIVPLSTQMAVMASVPHNEVATVLAMHSYFGSIGASIGLAVSGAIWTNTLPGRLVHHLPADLKDQAMAIYADIEVQLGYEWGSPGREAIVAAYGDVQRLMAIAGAALMPLLFLSILIWKDLNVKNLRQTKGNVF